MESPTDMTEAQVERILREMEAKFERKFQLYEMQLETLAVNTRDIVEAFNAAKGAFTVLGWFAKVAKPVLFIGAMVASLSVIWSKIKWPI